jgi:hypothetical protein
MFTILNALEHEIDELEGAKSCASRFISSIVVVIECIIKMRDNQTLSLIWASYWKMSCIQLHAERRLMTDPSFVAK